MTMMRVCIGVLLHWEIFDWKIGGGRRIRSIEIE